MASQSLPELPAPLFALPEYIAQHPEIHINDILDPYRRYEASLRTLYAQKPDEPLLKDAYINILPLFANESQSPVTTRARDLSSESEEEKSKYIIPLPEDQRRPHGSPATVAGLAEFQKNFNIFSELSLSDLNWNNVVAAGSSVVNCLLPVPEAFKQTKRTLREYYHEKFCPASDVDLFLYGLSHDEAIEKIKQIERAVKDALLHEVTVVRTKYAITIASQYPVRHIQIVLRVYKNISEILTGFDIDASGAAYDGSQVHVTPRALASFITQVNHIDLTRRSPSYENRLSKYTHRNFEIYWPDLERSRVDPTIFERNFKRTLGLARLLVLERLPTSSSRDAYLDKRRQERGRPAINRGYVWQMGGNIKDDHEDEIAEWVCDEEVSSYNTFTIPYGVRYNAKRIEKLCYTRDLLLNAEWNKPEERNVNLHRHPAFFGRVKDVIGDCCGSCPKPTTDEEIETAEKEGKRYVSGKISFLVDDPGRQEIGSFNPLTEQDWTDMAYVGNTARLCQSIIAGDLEEVQDWLSQTGADVNQRDYTGRTPLQLAVISSTPEIVDCLVESGARMISRMADGKTALHLAAARGQVDMIRTLMEKSLENAIAEDEKEDERNEDDSDIELIDQAESEDDESTTEFFVKIRNDEDEHKDLDGATDDPDIFDIDVLAWDVPCSPLHLAIAGGHEEAVMTLCDYSADSILPVKFLNHHNREEVNVILTLALALTLPSEKAKSMAALLCSLGATASQGESNGATAFHRYVKNGKVDIVQALQNIDKAGVKRAINHILISGSHWNPYIVSVLHTAIELGDPILVVKLLEMGAEPNIKFETWLKSAKFSPTMAERLGDLQGNKETFRQNTEQPLISAICRGQPEIAMRLLEAGADPNTLTTDGEMTLINESRRSYTKGHAALDVVQLFITQLTQKIEDEQKRTLLKEPTRTFLNTEAYLDKFTPGSYQHWIVAEHIKICEQAFENKMKDYEEKLAESIKRRSASEEEGLKELKEGYEALRDLLTSKGAKTFDELHPEIKCDRIEQNYYRYRANSFSMKPTDFTFAFNFFNDQDITDERNAGYVELMEAAWTGDIEKLKALTLQPWGPKLDRKPLRMAVYDADSNNPFSLAFLRGHHEAAKAVLEIVRSQWAPKEQEKMVYTMKKEGEDDDMDDEDAEDDEMDDGPEIVAEKADKKFTIDNIGTATMVTTSTIKPYTVIKYDVARFTTKDGQVAGLDKGSLFRHCFDHDDFAGMKFLIEQARYWAAQKFTSLEDSDKVKDEDEDEDEDMEDLDEEDDEDNEEKDEAEEEDEEGEEVNGVFRFPESDLQHGIENGKTELVGLVISLTGAGVPLETLIEQYGVQKKKKSKYYQGLTVYGKKRSDWAAAGRGTVVERRTGMASSPLSHAAHSGSIESVEYFLSDTPYRLYSEFGTSGYAAEDPRVKTLTQVQGGYDQVVLKWLTEDSDLIIHKALECGDAKREEKLIKYLVKACPIALEKKRFGKTPLLQACMLNEANIMKILIGARADQSVRILDTGENLLHMLLQSTPSIEFIREAFALVDPELRPHLFIQRKKLTHGGTAPIHSWVSMLCGENNYGSYAYDNHRWRPYNEKSEDAVQIFRLLFELSNGEGLDLLNGTGDTVLHTAVMYRHVLLIRAIIQARPQLLYRENAVGRTPAEIAYDNLTAAQFVPPKAMDNGYYYRRNSLDYMLRNIVPVQKPQEGGLASAGVSTKAREIGLTGEYTPQEIEQITTLVGLNGNDKAADIGSYTTERVIWDLCSTAMENHPHPRRLVSLNEANDVARRLGEQNVSQRYCSNRPNKVDEGSDAN